MLTISPLYPRRHLLLKPQSPQNPNHHAKPTLSLCKSTPAHDDDGGPQGTGAAAPTRGDLFLERQQAVNATRILLKNEKLIKKKKTKAVVVDTSVSRCYGCGAVLHCQDIDAPGYVDSQTYQLKKKHRQLRTVLCGRCKLLSHGHMITAVGGHGGYPGGKQFVSADQLRLQLSHLRFDKALIIKLVDIVDFNGSFLTHIRNLVGSNPIILVITKIDLLPKGTDFSCVGDWIVEAITKKKLNVLSIHLTSSKSLVGIAGVASEIHKEKKGRDVYILGSANVGKSAFTNALLSLMAEKDPIAAAAKKYKPMQSAVPGTTLGPIQIDAFLGGGKLYDTPGVHLHHRQTAVIHSEDLPILAPRSRLRAQCVPGPHVCIVDDTANKDESSGLAGFSVFWGGLVRIDILKSRPEMCLTFYGPKALKIHMVSSDKADEFYQKEVGVLLTPPSRKEKANDVVGLEPKRHVEMTFDEGKRPACDVAISGLGWISVEPTSRSSKPFDLNHKDVSDKLHLVVHVPKPVEIFVRSSMPVGKAGAEWYQYRELTEEEEEMRPRLYY